MSGRRPFAAIAAPAALLLALGTAGAQTPPGLSIPEATATAAGDPDPASPAGRRTALGDEALAAGHTAEAVAHFVAALGFHPCSPSILRRLVLATEGDARAAWAYRWWLAVADERGRATPDREMKAALGSAATQLRALAAARAAAVEELAKLAKKLKTTGRSALGQGVVARWATDFAWELVQPAPALQRRQAAAFAQACQRHEPDYATVLHALEKAADYTPPASTTVASNGHGNGDGNGNGDIDGAAAKAQRAADDIAIRAARCLTGLAAQAAFKKLEGPEPPELGGLAAEARATRAALRQKIERRAGEPYTVEQLRQMTPPERRVFTERHATWADPGVAVSPNGWYLVQTTCGHGTLLGAASTIELHHRRLADWFGSDPFAGRRGLVRIVPEAAGLEAEDSPFWWAGGFQRGDLTTVRFAWSDIGSLGRGLTHELTHRFDGALHSFLPAWLTEGRAVWTASAYASVRDEHFVSSYLNHHSVQTPFIKGYGRAEKLEDLIGGEIDDYRDNYSAGHALFVFLNTWEVDGVKPFAERLQKFMRNARAGQKKPLAFFVSQFADGEDGRPKGLEEFAGQFKTFLEGCYQASWGEKVPWLDRYTASAGKGDRNPLVEDDPTFSWARHRAEPWFGERHAARAGNVLADIGQDRAAAAALLWSLRTDGWEREAVARLADLLRELRVSDAEWILRRRLGEPAGRAPMLSGLPRTSALLRALGEAVTAQAGSGHALAARALGDEHNRLAAFVGVDPVALPDLPAAEAKDGEPPYPLVEPQRSLGLYGWTEDGLTDYEERRVEGLWFETEEGDLHVGRKKDRDTTGLLDRRAQQRDAYLRTVEWQPAGHYVLRTRVHFTTSFVSGAVILGSSRRDRNLRIRFRAGDFLYSIGRKEGSNETKSVGIGLSGLWERDRHLPDAEPWHLIEFEQPASYFDLEVRVDGPTVRVTAAGQSVFSYTAPDRAPIEGFIGVAMSQGAVRMQRPTIQRLDRGVMPIADGAAVGLDLGRAEPKTLEEMLRRPTRGIPLAPDGTLVIVLPRLEDSRRIMRRGLAALRVVKRFVGAGSGYPQKWALALPQELEETVRVELVDAAEETCKGAFTILEHHFEDPFAPQPWILFVDGFGVLRAAESLAGQRAIPKKVDVWARRYRPR